MIARISTGKSIKGALYYNENKIEEREAFLLMASNFGCDIADLSVKEKLKRFEKLTDLNEKVKTNALHLSLSFHRSENIDDKTLQSIAKDYIERIGFGKQPFLVYKHTDTRNTHIHILTTNIKKSGRYISMNNIGRNKSEPARQAIEIEYGLIQAKGRSNDDLTADGERNKISNVVRDVFSFQKYCSFEEYRALLRLQGVSVEQTKNLNKDGKPGLVYCKVDKYGQKTGIPINASSIYTSPTFAKLEKKYIANEEKRAERKPRMQIKFLRMLQSKSVEDFNERLHAEKLAISATYNKEGSLTSLFFIDKISKTAFSSDELGISAIEIEKLFKERHSKTTHQEVSISKAIALKIPIMFIKGLHILLQPEYVGPEVNEAFFKKKKKKKSV